MRVRARLHAGSQACNNNLPPLITSTMLSPPKCTNNPGRPAAVAAGAAAPFYKSRIYIYDS
jgi:hypothetical protein